MRLPHIIPLRKPPLYFFTACTVDRRPLLACSSAFSALMDIWQKPAQLDGWYVGRFVLMPDQVHFFAMPTAEAKPRGVWIKMWKSVTARRLAMELKLKPPIWQEDAFDHILRGVESYQAKMGLCAGESCRGGSLRQS